MQIDPAAVLAVISGQSHHIATLTAENAQLRQALTEQQTTEDDRLARRQP
ncbi:hypothetical protein [Georgenia sp. AZ-5]